LSDLQVNSVEEAAEAIRQVLAGDKGPRRDIALLNTAAALVIAGVSHDLAHGLSEAADAIDTGLASSALDALIRCSTS
jgi:anthranilate phosphoribosyltransferase